MSDIEIRQLTESDAEIYRHIRLEMLERYPEAFGTSYEDSLKENIQFFESMITNSNIYGAFKNNIILGVAGSYIKEGSKVSHVARMWGVYVKAEARGKNIALILTEKIISELPDCIKIIRTSVASGNIVAEKVYQKAGFKKWAIEEKALKIDNKYYDEIHMEKFLEEK